MKNAFPEHNEFESVGTGTVKVTFRYSERNKTWAQWIDRKEKCADELESSLSSFVDNLSYFSRHYGDTGYGDMIGIAHIGFRPGDDKRATYHNIGMALDITWIQWAGGNASKPMTANKEAQNTTTHRRLIAVEAGLRKWFGYVLNRGIPKHYNHFHIDQGCDVALRLLTGSKLPGGLKRRPYTSCAYFVQDCVNAFTDFEVPYDGIWGSESKSAYAHLLSDLGMECLDPSKNINEYMLFLDYIMMHGFADRAAGAFRWGDERVL